MKELMKEWKEKIEDHSMNERINEKMKGKDRRSQYEWKNEWKEGKEKIEDHSMNERMNERKERKR